jgi:hypothetical protein
MKKASTRTKGLLVTLVCAGLLIAAVAGADTKTTTTTTTHPDGTTTTVEETTTSGDSSSDDTDYQTRQRNIVGPTGATGTIRRSDRRQDRRAGDPRLD